MSAREKAAPKEVQINNALPILYVDAIDTRRREDGFNYLSFATNAPHAIVEQVRLVVEDESLHMIIDDICRTINYYPKKPSKKE